MRTNSLGFSVLIVLYKAMNAILKHHHCRRLPLCLILGLAWLGASSCSRAEDLVPLPITNGPPVFIGTPPNNKPDPNIDINTNRPLFPAPAGVTNVALHKKVTSSLTNAAPEDLARVTDGEKNLQDRITCSCSAAASNGCKLTWSSRRRFFAIVVWHAYDKIRSIMMLLSRWPTAPISPRPKMCGHFLIMMLKTKTAWASVTNREYFETN